MASESSSAVLDMKDECEEGGSDSVTPLIMEHGYDIAVKVDSPLKQLSTLETYVTYRVRCVCARWPTPAQVRRRYNHFKVLHKRLCGAHPLLPVPPLPPLHSPRQQLDRYSPGFVAVRSLALDAFLCRVAKHPILTHSEDFRLFLTTADQELDKVLKSDSGPMNLWGISSVLAGGHDPKNNNGVRVKDPEFSSAADYLQSLQQKLMALCTLTTKLHKDTAALSKDYCGMKRVCDAWSVRERGHVYTAVGGVGGAAGAAGGCRGAAGGEVGARAVLPLLAAYSGAVRDKIGERDALHAAHVAGTNSTDIIHNRLEQASEALRSELIDWNTKTRSEVKRLLLELADKQVAIHRHSLTAWEHGLKLTTETDPEHIFKTVSKNCIQNLSPSKCKADDTPTETEKDLEDFDMEDDFDISEKIRVQRNDDASFSSEELRKEFVEAKVFENSVLSDPLSEYVEARMQETFDEIVSFSSEKVERTGADVRSNESQSKVEQLTKSGVSDPLSEFAEVDLSKDDDL